MDAGEEKAELGPALFGCNWKYPPEAWFAGGRLNVVTFGGAERVGWGKSDCVKVLFLIEIMKNAD